MRNRGARTARRMSAAWQLLKQTVNGKTTMRDLTPAQQTVLANTQNNLAKSVFRE